MNALSFAFYEHQPLAPFTSWQIGGPADLYAEPVDLEHWEEALLRARREERPVLVMGGGSNLLVSDAGVRGLVLRPGDASEEFREVDDAGDRAGVFRIGARALLAPTARRLSRSGWAGLEWAEGIPGTIGGAIVGNAGAYGGEMATVVGAVELYTLDRGLERVPREACGFGYRQSRWKEAGSEVTVVVGAELRLSPGEPGELEARMRSIAAERKRKTPAGLSCGSVFKNPPGRFAGQLVEGAGMRGAEEGAAQISPLHGNYIVNRGGATATEVLRLIERARAAVRAEFGIDLELEVRLVGF